MARSRSSGGVRSSALDMFHFKESTFDFLRKKISETIFVEKSFGRFFFFEETIFFILGFFSNFVLPKIDRFFSTKMVFEIFFLKKSKVHDLK